MPVLPSIDDSVSMPPAYLNSPAPMRSGQPAPRYLPGMVHLLYENDAWLPALTDA
jgi:hypothetical protein